MKTFVILCSLVLWLGLSSGVRGLAHAGQADAEFEQANHAFAEGRYDEAVTRYESIISHHGYSAALLFNLGNAHLRAGHTGAAILSYERARLLSPADPDILANLRFARKTAFLYVPDPPFYENAAHLLSQNAWAWMGSLSLLLLCAGIALLRLGSGLRSLLLSLTLASGLLLSTAVVALVLCRPDLDSAVVLAREAQVRISPFDTAQPLFSLPEGEVVRVRQAHGQFVLVQNREGRTGWMSFSQVQPVLPAVQPAS